MGKPAGGFRALATTDVPAAEILQRASTHASFCERKAMEVEREVVDLYRAFFMRDRVGDVLAGSISGVTSFGIFVVIDEPFVEGLVRTDYLAPDDFYDFDEVACRLSGRRSGKAFSLGDRVEVEILQVSVARRRIELRLRDGGKTKGDRTPRQDHKGKSKVRAPKKASRHERRQKIRTQNSKRPKARR